MTDTDQTTLSIVLVSYNSLTDLRRCLPTIQKQAVTFRYELIVVDNHGADGVADFITVNFPTIRLILNPANTGYAGGNNIGLQNAIGDWILFLNPDTELALGCLERLIATARNYPQALINPKLLNADGTINACGNQMHYTGITTCRGLHKLANAYQSLETVPLLSGAALLVPTAVARRLNGFAESYFMYFEDADLSLRARLAGHVLLCEARSVLTHHYKLNMSADKFYYLERNRLQTILRIFSRQTLRQLWPALLLTELLTWVYAIRSWTYLKARFRGYIWLRTNWQIVIEQRHSIQQHRLVSDQLLMNDSLTALPFTQLIGGQLGKTLENLSKPLFRLLKPCTLR